MAYVNLNGLYDCASLARELGISRKVATQIMLRVPKQPVPGVRKKFVRGEHVQELLDKHLIEDKSLAPLKDVA